MVAWRRSRRAARRPHWAPARVPHPSAKRLTGRYGADARCLHASPHGPDVRAMTSA